MDRVANVGNSKRASLVMESEVLMAGAAPFIDLLKKSN
jgi:hypothetical protein